MAIEIRALERDDDRKAFRSGDGALDLFFSNYAGQNQFRYHVGVTYVAVDSRSILGFVTVSPATLDAEELRRGRKMPPYPLPVLRIARLAVDERARGQGLGKALLKFCIQLACKMQEEVGCVGLLVDAKAEAVAFYERYGFATLPILSGGSRIVPAPTPMFVALGSTGRMRR